MTGLTTTHWITIGLAVWTSVLSVASLVIGGLARRFLRQVDGHGTAIAELREQLGSKVSRSAHDVANAEMTNVMERMRSEANAREQRILEAIDKARAENSRENRVTRRELSGMHARIDRIRDQQQAQAPAPRR